MNTATTYQNKAQSTKAQRKASGYYATVAHLAAGRKLIAYGVTGLTADDLETLSTHPFMTSSQRANFADLAAKLRK